MFHVKALNDLQFIILRIKRLPGCISNLCGLCLPDLKIIQTGENLCIFFAVIFSRKGYKGNKVR
jgi:hypothetical protein